MAATEVNARLISMFCLNIGNRSLHNQITQPFYCNGRLSHRDTLEVDTQDCQLSQPDSQCCSSAQSLIQITTSDSLYFKN